MTKKKCKDCGEEKDLDKFSREASGKLGRRPKCKICEKKHRSKKIETDLATGVTTKKCSKCKIEKTFGEFNKNRNGKFGVLGKCRVCDKKCNIASGITKSKIISKKACSKCKLSKPLEDFCRDKFGKLGRSSRCKQCKKSILPGSRNQQKICVCCNIPKYVRFFYDAGHGLFRKTAKCIKCTNKIIKKNTCENTTFTKQCKECNIVKKGFEFSVCKIASDILNANCKICVKKTKNEKSSTFEKFIEVTYKSLRSSASLRNLKVEIAEKDITELYHRQNGKCALTGITLTHTKIVSDDNKRRIDKSHNHNISVDRIDSSGDYVIDNIQLVASCVNLMKKK